MFHLDPIIPGRIHHLLSRCLVLAFIFSLHALPATPQDKAPSHLDSLWLSVRPSESDVAEALRAVTPIARREFELSQDSLSKYILEPDAAIRLHQKRIQLTFYHPDLDALSKVGDRDAFLRSYLKGFPLHFEAYYFPATKRVELSWEATPNQLRMAEAIALPFLRKTLTDIHPDSLKLYRIKHWSHVVHSRKQIILYFYNPSRFPDWERLSGMRGGYPDYFSVTIDVKTKKVVGLYNFQF